MRDGVRDRVRGGSKVARRGARVRDRVAHQELQRARRRAHDDVPRRLTCRCSVAWLHVRGVQPFDLSRSTSIPKVARVEVTFLRADALALRPGEAATHAIELLPLAMLFRRGHRIRVSLAGADVDHFATSPSGGAVRSRRSRPAGRRVRARRSRSAHRPTDPVHTEWLQSAHSRRTRRTAALTRKRSAFIPQSLRMRA